MFEHAGVVFNGREYIASTEFEKVITGLKPFLSEEHEHQCYKLGGAKFFEWARGERNNKLIIVCLKNRFGKTWNSVRYHNLVRLGGDVLRFGLGGVPLVVLLGALVLSGAIKQEIKPG